MKDLQTQDLYLRLGITSEASQKEIKKAYKLKIFEFHPDRNHSPDARQQYDAIAEAYATLSDPVKRQEYDQIHWIFKGLEEKLSALNKESGKKDISEMLKTCDQEFNKIYNRKGKIETWSNTGAKNDIYV